MDKITATERELLNLGLPPGIELALLRRLADDIYGQASEMKSAHALTLPLANIQARFEVSHNLAHCERVASVIWGMAHSDRA
jgi:hypothetical protein